MDAADPNGRRPRRRSRARQIRRRLRRRRRRFGHGRRRRRSAMAREPRRQAAARRRRHPRAAARHCRAAHRPRRRGRGPASSRRWRHSAGSPWRHRRRRISIGASGGAPSGARSEARQRRRRAGIVRPLPACPSCGFLRLSAFFGCALRSALLQPLAALCALASAPSLASSCFFLSQPRRSCGVGAARGHASSCASAARPILS